MQKVRDTVLCCLMIPNEWTDPVTLFVDGLTVRLLHWSNPTKWAEKLKAADAIEVYDPARPNDGEYIRTRIAATATAASTATATTTNTADSKHQSKSHADFAAQRVQRDAWMYVSRSSVVNPNDWVHIPSGDWLKRDRTSLSKPIS